MEHFLNSFLGPDEARNRSFRQANDGFRNAASSFQMNATRFMTEAMDPQNAPETTKVPPASAKALRQLPLIQVTPQDLVEESNRECCICLEPHEIGQRVIRLPCAHIFHPTCGRDWLMRSCTCPVCRFELETDDARYEQQRKKRMKQRKPRFARYELQRMSQQELYELCKKLRVGRLGTVPTRKSAGDYIRLLELSDKVHIMEAPPPVEYRLDYLKGLSIKRLKQTMADAGVFFDPKDVVEKTDMISIFVNSGRLVVLDAEHDSCPASNTIFNYEFERKQSIAEISLKDEDFGEAEEQSHGHLDGADEMDIVLEETRTSNEHANGQSEDAPSSFQRGGSTITVETVTDEEGIERPRPLHKSAIEMFANVGSALQQLRRSQSVSNAGEQAQQVEERMMEVPPVEEVAPPPDPRLEFHGISVGQLMSIAARNEITLPPNTLERSEIVDALVEAGVSAHLEPKDFATWSVSQIRAVASEVGVDLSNSLAKEEMVHWLVLECRENNGVSKYVSTLIPLVNLSVSQLRAVAREWQVNVRDCVEKEELIHRLVLSAGVRRGT